MKWKSAQTIRANSIFTERRIIRVIMDTGCVHLISLMWLEDVIASSSSSS